MNYHIDEKLLEKGEISITIDGKPIDQYTLNEITNELLEIFHDKKPTTEELRKEIIRMLIELDNEWQSFTVTVEEREAKNRIMNIHDYLLIKKFEDLSGTEDLPF